MISLGESVEHLKDRRDQASQNFVGDVGVLTKSITKVSSKLNQLDALNLETKMMQQRIKRMEESWSAERQSSTVPESAQVSRRLSPTVDEKPIPREDAPSNRLIFSANRTPMSTYFDDLYSPRNTTSERLDVMNGGGPSYQGLPLGFKYEPLPPLTPFITRPKTSVNGTAGKGSLHPVNRPPPRISRKASEQKNIIRSSPTASSNVTTPRTASTSVAGTTNPTSLSRFISQMQEASGSFRHGLQERHIYDDDLVSDNRSRSSHGLSIGNARQRATNTARSRQNRNNGITQQPLLNSQRRLSVPMRLCTLERGKPDGLKIADQDQHTHHPSR